jgi:anaerobic magnesium-protoporphyrin IX monomethyl ester cyclase
VKIIDCTFISENQVVQSVRACSPRIIGIYSMFSMKSSAIHLAEILRGECELLVAGGPLPTLYPDEYLEAFDVVCVGEGEETMLELVKASEKGIGLSKVSGIWYRSGNTTNSSNLSIVGTPPRPPIEDLDSIPFPARDLFDNAAYQNYFMERFGRKETSMITTRGCPFDCDFCSRPIFSRTFRARSAENVVSELADLYSFGYDWVWFSDDCFTLNVERILDICSGIKTRSLDLKWECLSRVDTLNLQVANAMKLAGCKRVFLGIESGDDGILREMRKQVTVADIRRAVDVAVEAGLESAGFFIVGYPGENDTTILKTLKLATQLPLDYVSFSLPYPIPGTGLWKRVRDRIGQQDWQYSPWRLIDHALLYDSEFSEFKLKFAIAKGAIQHRIMKHGGKTGYDLAGRPFEALTDMIFTKLK